MNGAGDYDEEMSPRRQLDDETIEAFFADRPLAADRIPCLAAFAEEVRVATEGPVPSPSAALARILAEGFFPEKGDLPATAASNVTGPAPQAAGLPKRRSRRMVVTELLAGLTMWAKAGLGLTMAAASVTAAGAAGVLPEPVEDAVEVVVPFSFPDNASDKADFGEGVSTEASGEKGVDGKSIADEAKRRSEERQGSTEIPEVPASNGQRGLDQANTTPAAGHAPTSVRDGRATADERRPSQSTDRQPSGTPTGAPEGAPAAQPSGPPTGAPEGAPAAQPSGTPTGAPEGAPAAQPSGTPTGAPQGTPTGQPSGTPTGAAEGTPTAALEGTPGGRR